MVEPSPPPGAGPGRATAAGLAGFAQFAEAVFESLPRADQRRWARAYLYGLLHAPGRKTVRQLAAEVSSRDSAADALRQFVNASPWDWRPVRRELTRWVARRADVQAWALSPAVLPKRGPFSCGVHRRFVPQLGRVAGCQSALGLFLCTPAADYPVDWSLALPGAWSTDERLRARARIPEPVRQEPLPRRALSLVEQAAACTPGPPVPVVADLTAICEATDNAAAAALADALGQAGYGFVLTVPADLPALPADWDGTGVRSVRVPGVRMPCVLFDLTAKRPDGPATAVLTNLDSRRAARILDLVGRHSRTRAAVSALAREHGLLDFEGRSFPGWHHHVTLVSAAYSYGRLAAAGPRPAQSNPAPSHSAQSNPAPSHSAHADPARAEPALAH